MSFGAYVHALAHNEIKTDIHTGWAKKTGLFLTVDNFATVSDREACNMSKVCKFYLEKGVKLACQCI